MTTIGEIKTQVGRVGGTLKNLIGNPNEDSFSDLEKLVDDIWPYATRKADDKLFEPFENLKGEFRGWIQATRRAYDVGVVNERKLLEQSNQMQVLLMEFVQAQIPFWHMKRLHIWTENNCKTSYDPAQLKRASELSLEPGGDELAPAELATKVFGRKCDTREGRALIAAVRRNGLKFRGRGRGAPRKRK
jgi:hypothetical protein